MDEVVVAPLDLPPVVDASGDFVLLSPSGISGLLTEARSSAA